MQSKMLYIYYIILSITLFCSCKSLNTNLSIRETKIPTSYHNLYDTNSIARINWRNYFADPVLTDLIDTALANNLDFQIALQRIQIARSGLRFQKGELLPKIDGNVSVGSIRYGKYTESGQGNATTPYPDNPDRMIPNPVQNYFIGLTSSWEIDIWGKLKNQKESAISIYMASVEGQHLLTSNLISEVAISYYELLTLDNQLEIIRENIAKQNEALEIVKTLKEEGKTNLLAVQQFQSQWLNSRAEEKEILQSITEVENKINFLLGRFPQAISRNKSVLFQKNSTLLYTGIPSQLLSNRPDIREAEYLVQASKFDVLAAKKSFLPSLNISAAFGFQAFDPKFLLSTPASLSYNTAGGLIAPLINRTGLIMNFSNAKSNQITALYNYQKAILNGYVEVANELSNIHNLDSIYSLKKEQSEVMTNSVETASELFKSGRANYLEVLLAHQNSLTTRLEYLEVIKKQKIATIAIYKALGGGWK